MPENDEHTPQPDKREDQPTTPANPTPNAPSGQPPTPQQPAVPTPPVAPVPDSEKEPNRRRWGLQPRKDDQLDGNDPNDERDPLFSDNPSYDSPTALVCWVLFGFFFGLIGILACWFVVRNQESPVKSKAILFSVMGCSIDIFLGMLYMLFTGDNIFALYTSGGTSTGATKTSTW